MSKQNGFTVFRHQQKKALLQKIKARKGDGFYREGSFSDEVIWQDRKFLFPSPSKKVSQGIWVFRSVMNDVRHFISDKRIREKERLPVNRWNEDLNNFRGKVTATDIDHAYWKIAYLQGVITNNTYNKGLLLKDKSLRLAALANLASSKEYKIIKDGIITNKSVVLRYDPILQKIYNNIRFTCYEHMNILAELLDDQFICYKTDCIYYRDIPKNRELVQTYLDTVDLDWKQLIEPERPKKEKQSGTNQPAF